LNDWGAGLRRGQVGRRGNISGFRAIEPVMKRRRKPDGEKKFPGLNGGNKPSEPSRERGNKIQKLTQQNSHKR